MKTTLVIPGIILSIYFIYTILSLKFYKCNNDCDDEQSNNDNKCENDNKCDNDINVNINNIINEDCDEESHINCEETKYGCCPGSDKIKIDKEGSNCPIPHCKYTEYGCCNGTFIPKLDEKGSNCPSICQICNNKCPETIHKSEKLINAITNLLKECKEEEIAAENKIKKSLNIIKDCIKEDIKYRKIAKNYDEAINILEENIKICNKKTKCPPKKNIQKNDCNLNLGNLIDELYQ